MDCDRTENQGCNGGYPDKAFEFIISNKGLSTESDYPYEEADDSCKRGRATSLFGKISGYENVPANSEAALLKAVAHQPVSVAIDASGYNFRFHESGVFTGECGTALNHAVTIVGYGESREGLKYWLVKNSWGIQWGETGYIRMLRDSGTEEGICGIAMHATYPTA